MSHAQPKPNFGWGQGSGRAGGSEGVGHWGRGRGDGVRLSKQAINHTNPMGSLSTLWAVSRSDLIGPEAVLVNAAV